jgi:hypothetical protein
LFIHREDLQKAKRPDGFVGAELETIAGRLQRVPRCAVAPLRRCAGQIRLITQCHIATLAKYRIASSPSKTKIQSKILFHMSGGQRLPQTTAGLRARFSSDSIRLTRLPDTTRGIAPYKTGDSVRYVRIPSRPPLGGMKKDFQHGRRLL